MRGTGATARRRSPPYSTSYCQLLSVTVRYHVWHRCDSEAEESALLDEKAVDQLGATGEAGARLARMLRESYPFVAYLR